jgi:uncharacterized protein YbjQ (UPF0145 family)
MLESRNKYILTGLYPRSTGGKEEDSMDHAMTTTTFTIDGFRITHNLGVVRGIVVRSRSIFGAIGAALQTPVGGNITLYTNLCEKTRSQAFDIMLSHAAELGANAVVGVRYDVFGVRENGTVRRYNLIDT